MRSIAITLFILTLSGCAKGKGFYSVWSTAGHTLNTSNITFGQESKVSYGFPDGSACECSATFTGAEASGDYLFNHCEYAGGGDGDPVCGYLASRGTYAYATESLTLTSVLMTTYR